MAPTAFAIGNAYATPNNHTNPSTATGGTMPAHQIGDVLLMFAWFDTGATTSGQTLSTPAGWTSLGVDADNLANGMLFHVYFRYAASAAEVFTSPSFAGGTTGTSGGTGIARVATLRSSNGTQYPSNVSAAMLLAGSGTATFITTAAQNITNIAGFTPTANETLIVVCGGKRDDWTSVAQLTGDSVTWGAGMEAVSTSGGDAGMVINAGSQTTAGAITAKTFTVTGGATEKSAGRMFALREPAQVSAPVLDLIWTLDADAALTPVDGPVLALKADLAAEVNAPVLDLQADLRSEVDGPVLDLQADLRAEANGGYATEVLADNPAVYWRLGESSGTTAEDATANNRDGTITGATLGQSGAVGDADKAASFDGVDDYVAAASYSFNPASTATVEAWVYPLAFGQKRAIISNYESTGRGSMEIGCSNFGELFFSVWNTSNVMSILQPGWPHILDGGKWCHVVGTTDGTTMRLYLNGVEIQSTTAPATLYQTGTPGASVGRGGGGSTYAGFNWQGKIDEAAFYTTALSPARIAAHYKAGVGPVLGLKWDTRAKVDGPVLDLIADLYAGVDADVLDLIWDLRAEVSADPLDLQWSLLGDIPSYYAEVMADAPGLYWRFEEVAGAVAVDSSGNGRNGTISGATPGTVSGGPPGIAYTFDGVDDAVVSSYVPWTTGGTEPITVEAWQYRAGSANNDPFIGASGTISQVPNFTQNTIHVFSLATGRSTMSVSWPATNVVSLWRHVVMTYDPATGNAELFLNAVSQGVLTMPAGDRTWPSGVAAIQAGRGGTTNAANSNFNGTLDEIAVYPTILSSARIAAHYAARVNPSPMDALPLRLQSDLIGQRSYPAIASTSAGGNVGGANSTITFAYPSGVQAGDLLLLVVGTNGTFTTISPLPAGFVTLGVSSGTQPPIAVAYKWADGSEIGNLSVGTSQARGKIARCYRITGAHPGQPPEWNVAAGTSINPDSPSLNPVGWDTEETLWIAVLNPAGFGVTAYPSGYTNGTQELWDGSVGAKLASATREYAFASEDPGPFTIDSSQLWRAATIAIRPNTAVAPSTLTLKSDLYAAVADGPNQISNSWKSGVTTGWGATTGVTMTVSTEQAHSGTQSLKLVNADAGQDDYAVWSSAPDFTIGTSYLVEAWFFCEDFQGGSISDRIIFVWDGVSPAFVPTLTAPTVGWQKLEYVFRAAVTTTSGYLRLHAPKGTIYWDDVSIKPVGVGIVAKWDVRNPVDAPARTLQWDTRAAVNGDPLDLVSDLYAEIPGSAYLPAVLADAPVAYWRLGDTGSVVGDSTGAFHGSYVGGAQGQPGATVDGNQAVTFDGIDDYATVTTLGNFGQSVLTSTVEFWIKTTTTATSMALGTINTGTSMQIEVGLNTRDGTNPVVGSMEFTIRGNGAGYIRGYIHLPAIYDGNWHHVVWVAQGNTILHKCWVDGVERTVISVNTGTLTTPINFGFPLILGGWNLRGVIGNFAAVTLDEVAFYTTRLSQARIQAHYAAASAAAAAPLRLIWDVLSAAAVDGPILDLVWDTRAEVTAPQLRVVSDLRSLVNGDVLDLPWDLRSTVTASQLRLLADLRAEVNGQTRTLKWDTRSEVAAAVLDLLWDLRVQATGTPLSLRWDLAAEVARALALKWDLPAEVAAQVLDLQWDVRNAVDAPVRTLKWDTRSEVERLLTLAWRLRATSPFYIDYAGPLMLVVDAITRGLAVTPETRGVVLDPKPKTVTLAASGRSLSIEGRGRQLEVEDKERAMQVADKPRRLEVDR